MTEKKVSDQHHTTFDGIRHLDEAGNEFWQARQLAKVLEYSEYRHFVPVIDRAKVACQTSGQQISDHFEDVLGMVSIGSGAQRPVDDVRLSRYACYLIVQNGDPSKPVIANGQSYSALQTRRQELADDKKFAQLSEDEKRLAIRNELAAHNKHLAAAAKDAGVDSPLDYAIFQDHGYKGTVRRPWRQGYPRTKEPEEKQEDSGPHGQYGTRRQPVPRHANRRKASAR